MAVTGKYDIFKKTPDNSAVWIEEADDISQARKRLFVLALECFR